MSDQVDFLFVDKHQSFVHDVTIAYGVRGQVCPKYQKWQVSNIFVIVQKRGEGKIVFCMKMNIKVFYKLTTLQQSTC